MDLLTSNNTQEQFFDNVRSFAGELIAIIRASMRGVLSSTVGF
jgi:hypothetical protein